MMLGNFEVWILKFEVRALQRIAPPATRLKFRRGWIASDEDSNPLCAGMLLVHRIHAAAETPPLEAFAPARLEGGLHLALHECALAVLPVPAPG